MAGIMVGGVGGQAPTPVFPPPVEISGFAIPQPLSQELSVLNEQSKVELAKNLKDWLSGKIKVASKDKFKLPDQKPGKLNMQGSDINFLKDPNSTAYYQGLLLGEEIVSNHVIIYVGFQDAKGKNFYLPVNFGDIKNPKWKRYFQKQDNEIYPLGDAMGDMLSVKDAYTRLQKNNKKTVLLNLYPNAYYDPADVADTALTDINELNAQGKTTDVFVRWSFKTLKSAYAGITLPTALKTLLNKRVTKFNSKAVPAGFQVSTFGDFRPKP
jgi:hypothetical protein